MKTEWTMTVNGKEHVIVFEQGLPFKQSKLYIDNMNIDIPESAFVKMSGIDERISVGIDCPFSIEGKEYRIVGTNGTFVDLVENGILKRSKEKYIPLKALVLTLYLSIPVMIAGLLLYWALPTRPYISVAVWIITIRSMFSARASMIRYML